VRRRGRAASHTPAPPPKRSRATAQSPCRTLPLRTSCDRPSARDRSPSRSCIGGNAAAAAGLSSSMRLDTGVVVGRRRSCAAAFTWLRSSPRPGAGHSQRLSRSPRSGLLVRDELGLSAGRLGDGRSLPVSVCLMLSAKPAGRVAVVEISNNRGRLRPLRETECDGRARSWLAIPHRRVFIREPRFGGAFHADQRRARRRRC
jgi:hypothetical protein